MATLVSTNSDVMLSRPSGHPLERFRLESIDILRGVVMILMALDHTREYLGVTNIDPTSLTQTNGPLFFTRWITHFCAPVFFLLTGTSAYLSLRSKSRRELSRFLFTRGVWLIFLEWTVIRCLGIQFNFDYHVTLLNVLWALGWAMIVLSVLVHVPLSVTTALGVGMIAGHNLLDSIKASGPIWSILHCPTFVLMNPRYSVFVAYPLIPWIGVTAVGYSLGKVYTWPRDRREGFLLRAGLGLTAAFTVLRTINIYGDPARWTPQKSTLFTVLSFLNTSKYPPSLLFLLMTLGPALILLRANDRRTPELLRPVRVFGRVPMFYYLLHVPLIHLIAVAVCYLRYGQTHWMFESPSITNFPITRPPGWGLSLLFVYLIWAGVVLALYPLCSWFGGVKQHSREVWLTYF